MTPVLVSQRLSAGVGSVSSFTGNGSDTIVLNLTGVSDAQTITLRLDNVANGSISSDIDLALGFFSRTGTAAARSTRPTSARHGRTRGSR